MNIFIFALLFFSMPALAEEAERDDAAIFGEPSEEKKPEATENRLSNALKLVNDTTDIGGFMFIQGLYNTQEGNNFGNYALSAPALFDLFLDARPMDRLRAYIRGRLTHQFNGVSSQNSDVNLGGATTQNEFLLDQLWIKFDIDKKVFVTAGKQPLKWGSGHFWNPTDFVNNQIRDPLAVFVVRLGIPLLKIHVPLEHLGWNFYAIANFQNVSSPEDVMGALRAEMVFGTAELSLSAGSKYNGPHHFGADLSIGIGLFEVWIESAVHKGVMQTFYQGDFDPTQNLYPTAYSRADEWLPQVVAGTELTLRYNDEDNIVFGVEYFYNSLGYSNDTVLPWLIYNQAFTPLYVGQHYIGPYILLSAPGSLNDTTFILSAIHNISDLSALVRFDYRVRFLTYLDFNAYVAYHTGRIGEFRVGVDIPAIVGAPSPLDTGVHYSPQLLDFGVGLQMMF